MGKINLVLITLIIFSACTQSDTESNSEPQGIQLEFSAGGCGDDFVPSAGWKPEEGVKDVVWLDNTTLQVRGSVVLNCVFKSKDIASDYETSVDTITLIYITPIFSESVSCVCPHELIYTFYNLPKKDYFFDLVHEEYS